MKNILLYPAALLSFLLCSHIYANPIEKPLMSPVPNSPSESDTALANHLKSYANYNLWANQQFAEWLSPISEELARKEMVSSFPTIRATLFHLLNAEHGWFSWVKTGEWQSLDDSWKELSTPELWEKLCKKSQEITAYVENWTDSEWQVVHKRSNGLEMTRAEVFHTVFNHASYHRGQCITMGRQLGLTDPPRTDYVYYLSLK